MGGNAREEKLHHFTLKGGQRVYCILHFARIMTWILDCNATPSFPVPVTG
uniref:Uncharacterized protein n=1 Tax=Anguilla anguilla TaxID=7936 RepID=A0A0E9X3E0_ANGAN